MGKVVGFGFVQALHLPGTHSIFHAHHIPTQHKCARGSFPEGYGLVFIGTAKLNRIARNDGNGILPTVFNPLPAVYPYLKRFVQGPGTNLAGPRNLERQRNEVFLLAGFIVSNPIENLSGRNFQEFRNTDVPMAVRVPGVKPPALKKRLNSTLAGKYAIKDLHGIAHDQLFR